MDAFFVGVAVKVVNPGGVEGRGAAFDAVDLISLAEEEFGQVGTVLTGDAGDQGFFHDSATFYGKFPFYCCLTHSAYLLHACASILCYRKIWKKLNIFKNKPLFHNRITRQNQQKFAWNSQTAS